MASVSVVIRGLASIANSYLFHVGLTAPNPPPPPEETAKYVEAEKKAADSSPVKSKDTFPIPVAYMVILAKTLWHSMTLIELAAIATGVMGALPGSGMPDRLKDVPPLYLSTPSAIGLLLVIAGTMLRFECFRLLKKSFTFQLSVKQDHKLITSGPYGYVRHPAYTGSLMTLIGGMLVQLGPGSWCAERHCGVDTVALLGPEIGGLNWAGIVYGVSTVWMFSNMFRRCPVEDEVLKAHFQDEWVRWAQQVPYKMVPYVY